MGEVATKQETAPATITPMEMLQIAVERNADIDKLTSLMELKERWEATEARKAYVAAMSAFQENCPTIDKTLMAHNSKYAGLAETLEQIRPLMSEHRLSHSWKTEQNERTTSVTCTITHIGGHSESTTMTAPADKSGSKNDIQAIGSTVKYLQRYTLFSILGLASKENDDDGKAAGLGPTITPDQVKVIESNLESTGMKKERFLKAFAINAVTDLPASRFEEAKQRFIDYAAKAAESKK